MAQAQRCRALWRQHAGVLGGKRLFVFQRRKRNTLLADVQRRRDLFLHVQRVQSSLADPVQHKLAVWCKRQSYLLVDDEIFRLGLNAHGYARSAPATPASIGEITVRTRLLIHSHPAVVTKLGRVSEHVATLRAAPRLRSAQRRTARRARP